MVGGRRCGKTSALASVFNTVVEPDFSRWLTITNATQLKEVDEEKQDSLESKILEMRRAVGNCMRDRLTMVDSGPTMHCWDYTLQVHIPGRRGNLDMLFRDVPGEWFADPNGINFKTHVESFAKDCSVFVVVVDTPYLMGPVEEGQQRFFENKERDYVLLTGAMGTLTNLFTQVDGQNFPRLVIFCPIKCEKWAKENRMNEVIQQIENTYATLMINLRAMPMVDVEVVPIQTVGSLQFAEFGTPKYLNDINNEKMRCCPIDEHIVRMRDGSPRQLGDSDRLVEHEKDLLAGVFLRPAAWFELADRNNPGFAPYNCEQLPAHILRYMMKKYIAKANFWTKLWGKIFGTIDKNTLMTTLQKMQDEGVIKDNREGIVRLSRYLL